jgi:hypothetical protein
MRRILRHRPSPSMLVACVALVIAMGGTGYAAVQLPAGSVGTKQLKKKAVTGKKIAANAVTSGKVKNGSLLGADFAAGQLPAGAQGPQGPQGTQGLQGEKGDKGDPATNLFASVTSGGTLTFDKGVTGVVRNSAGVYFVTFNRDLTNCVASVTVGFGNPPGSNSFQGGATGHVWINGPGTTANGVRVTTLSNTNVAADQGFLLAVFC